MNEYNPTALVLCGPDFGHTDPQLVLPYGGQMSVDGVRRAHPGHLLTVDA